MDLSSREERFGRCFGAPGIVLEKSCDLSGVVSATQTYLRACRFRNGGKLNPWEWGNWTRNGELRPRKEVLGEWNAVESSVRDLVAPLMSGVALVQRVLAVRVKGGEEAGRYSSAHIHSDTWAGEPSGGVFMIPIEGDFENGGVEFYRPTQELGKLTRPYEGYEEVPNFGPVSIGKMKPGYLYVLDAACLHKTLRGQYRCSVDFRFDYKEKLDTDFRGWGKRLANYVPYSEWGPYSTEKTF